MKTRAIDVKISTGYKALTVGSKSGEIDFTKRPLKLKVYFNEEVKPAISVNLMIETAKQPQKTVYDIIIPPECKNVKLVFETEMIDVDLNELDYGLKMHWPQHVK